MKSVDRKGKTYAEIYGVERAKEIRSKMKKESKSTKREGGLHLDWKKAVKERDNFTCQKCGMTESEHKLKFGRGLFTHHIKGWDAFPELRFVLSNGTTLCNICHLQLHVDQGDVFDKEARSKKQKEIWSKVSKEERSEKLKRVWINMPKEVRSLHAKKGAETRRLKGWVTKKSKQNEE